MKLKGLVVCTALTGAAMFSTMSQASGADTFPSQDACGVTNNNTPVGNCGPFTQLWKENFNNGDVAVGKFSNCAGDHDHRCEGLVGTRYYDTVGAYPSGWPDTAGSGADGNNGPVPGVYRPESTISVATVNGDGVMRVKMYRPSTGGSNRVAAVVPRKCMNLRYGKFTERLIVRGPIQNGYKMAHLRYTPNEVDYPEAGGSFADPIYEYTHGFASSSAQAAPASAWTSGHTYSTEITPGKIQFFFDGKLFKTLNADFPDAADWILQNESALGDAIGAAPGSSVTIDTSWATCYKYTAPASKR